MKDLRGNKQTSTIFFQNIVLSRISCLKKDSNSVFYTYTHNPYRSNIGKICVLLKAEVQDINDDSKIFGKNICMQIAASKPMSIDVDDLDKELIKREEEIQVATIKSSGKPKEILEKILEGKMKKFFSEVTFLNQNFILDNDKSIKKVLEDLEKKVAYSNENNEVPSIEIIEANNDYKNQIIASNDLTRDMIRSVVELKKDIVDKYSNVENKQYKDLVNSYRAIKVNDDDEYNIKNDISYITEKNNTISKKLKDSNKTNRYLMIILIILVLITGASIFLFIRV